MAVVHWELWSKSPEKVADFYRNAFDWDINHIPEMDYHLVAAGEGGIGGAHSRRTCAAGRREKSVEREKANVHNSKRASSEI